MTEHQDANQYCSGAVYRIVWGLFGLFLATLGIYVIFFGAVEPLMRIGVGLLIALFGTNALWSAIQSKPPWLEKIILFI